MYKILLKCKFKAFQNLKKEALCLSTAPRTPISPPISFSALPIDGHHNSHCPPLPIATSASSLQRIVGGRGNVATEHSPRVRGQFWSQLSLAPVTSMHLHMYRHAGTSAHVDLGMGHARMYL